MAGVIHAYQIGRKKQIMFQQLPVMDFLGLGTNTPGSAVYFGPLLTSPVLNLKPGTWMATTLKTDLAVGFAILTGTGAHDFHVYWTKAVGFVLLVTLILAWIRYHSRPKAF